MEVLHLCIAKTGGGGAGTCGENMFTIGSCFLTAKGEAYMLCDMTLGLTFLLRDGERA